MDSRIEEYFGRIGYRGSREPTLAVLNALVRAHVESIPFENLDVLLGVPIELEFERVFEKFVTRRRGGYCFEHNGFFGAILEHLGYAVEYLSGRVRIQREADFTPARTHLFLLVGTPDGSPRHFVDVGVGGLSATSALPIEGEKILETPHETRRFLPLKTWARERGLVEEAARELAEEENALAGVLDAPVRRWIHQAFFGDAWHDVVEFTGERMPFVDRKLANFFTSTHPESHFKNRLMVARSTDKGRLTLLNDRLLERTRGPGGERVVETRFETKQSLRVALAERFSIEVDGELPLFRS